jgi:catechol-2,3-dioxygenase
MSESLGLRRLQHLVLWVGNVEQAGLRPPDEGVARMYHAAWEVAELTDLARARRRLIDARSLVGQSDHGTSLSLYAKDPDGPLDLEGELARRGLVAR